MHSLLEGIFIQRTTTAITILIANALTIFIGLLIFKAVNMSEQIVAGLGFRASLLFGLARFFLFRCLFRLFLRFGFFFFTRRLILAAFSSAAGAAARHRYERVLRSGAPDHLTSPFQPKPHLHDGFIGVRLCKAK